MTPVAELGMIDITPPGHGGMEVPATRFRVPNSVKISVEPRGEGAQYSPVPLELVVLLVDQGTKQAAYDERQPAWVVRIGDWRYDVIQMTMAGPLERGGIGSKDLVSIRLPGLLRRALRPLVLLVGDDGSYTIGADDPDERAITAYVTAQLVRDDPTKAVAAELGISANAAGQRVFRLRKAGRLPASKRGKKPCLDAPSLSAGSRPDAGSPVPPASTPPPSTTTTARKRGRSTS